MLNILLLLAGHSQFFNQEEHVFPKPLIEIDEKSMIQHVMENLETIKGPKKFICVVNSEDCKRYHLDNLLKILVEDDLHIVEVDNPTKGAVCSALLAIDYIDTTQPLLIINPDQIIESDMNEIISHFNTHDADAGVACFETVHPRWSYVRLDENNRINEAAEKRPISKHAIAGFYYFAKGEDFVSGSLKSIKKGSLVNGAYYVSMVLNELILDGKLLLPYHLDKKNYHTFYSPQKIEEFKKRKNISQNCQAKQKHGITVVIPMAGEGKRFVNEGYQLPKPFIEVEGKPMVAKVIENLGIPDAQYVLVARKEHIQENPDIVAALKKEYPVTFVEVNSLTEGTVCTVLLAREYIDLKQPLLIANCDQIVDVDINGFLKECFERNLDGSILTFIDPNQDSKWSFVKIDNRGFVTEVQEKKPISPYATVGIYLYSRGQIFVDSALDMIARNDRVNGEFYTCPTYNYAIKSGKQIGIYNIDFEKMNGIGTPEDLSKYLNLLQTVKQ